MYCPGQPPGYWFGGIIARSRSIRKARGTEEAKTSSNAGAAAWAKKASDAALQMDVASVGKPVGRKNQRGRQFLHGEKEDQGGARTATRVVPVAG